MWILLISFSCEPAGHFLKGTPEMMDGILAAASGNESKDGCAGHQGNDQPDNTADAAVFLFLGLLLFFIAGSAFHAAVQGFIHHIGHVAGGSKHIIF